MCDHQMANSLDLVVVCVYWKSHASDFSMVLHFWSRRRVCCVSKTNKFVSFKTCLAKILKQIFNWSIWNIFKSYFFFFLKKKKKVEIKIEVVNLHQENLARNFYLSHKNRLVFTALFLKLNWNQRLVIRENCF